MNSCAVATMSGSEALSAYDAMHEQLTELEALGNQLLARLDATGHAKQLGAHDTARLLAERYRLDPADATRRVKYAQALPNYPAVTAALPTPGSEIADGGVVLHQGQAQAIVSALEQIPKRANVPAEDLAAAEERMVEAARHLAPGDLRSLGVQIRNLLDTDGPEPREDAARAAEEVWIKKTDGGVKFGGRLAAENAELLELTLQYGAKPHKTETGEPDPRPRGKRYADALVDALAIAAGSGDLPTRGGIKPHLTITIDLDALIEAGKLATGDLMFGDGLSASAIRRLACDAGVIPLVLGSDSKPLDVGREQRTVTTALRNALIQRDRGCVVCHAPPIYCDGHHLVSWLDGGVTSLANSVLLCRVHHTALHQGHWTIEIIDNKVHVTRPPWTKRPQRAPNRRLVPPSTPATAPPAATATPTCPPTPTSAGTTSAGTASTRTASTGTGTAGTASTGTGTPSTPPGHWPYAGTDIPSTPSRRWPYADDATWIAPEEATTLNPWGDDPGTTDSVASSTHPSPTTSTPMTTPTTGATSPTRSAAGDIDTPRAPVVSLFDPWADTA